MKNQQATGVAANPIRRVVNMLQSMQNKIEEEGKKGEDSSAVCFTHSQCKSRGAHHQCPKSSSRMHEELYDKFQCYCKTSGSGLQDTIADGEEK
eukprot:1684862-Amphidinium_carterae.1